MGSRAERMGLHENDNIFLYSETRVVNILREMAAMQPRAVIVDSIQTVYLDDVTGSAGSISQVSGLFSTSVGEPPCTALIATGLLPFMPPIQASTLLQTSRQTCCCWFP